MAEPTAHEQQELAIELEGVTLYGNLVIPPEAQAIVLFIHGSGSSRFSPRNQHVARMLNGVGLATLLFDLLTRQEQEIDEQTRHLRFDIPMLGERTVRTVDWTLRHQRTAPMPIGLFGASTGAAAALIAAANRPEAVRAVVSRGGRPDLAGDVLGHVRAPTLLLVGEHDRSVIELNRQAAQQMRAVHHLEVIPGATHLFEEPGTLEQVARHAGEWFHRHLRSHAATAGEPAGDAEARQPD